MGTRHLICVVLDEEYKVAQYGQWDGHPEGQGKTVLEFLLQLTPERRAAFEEKIRNIHEVTEEDYKACWRKCGVESGKPPIFCGDETDKYGKLFPELCRSAGAEILELIMSKKNFVGVLTNVEFAGDSLFCEWAYVIDLDKNTFEVYKGWNKEPVPDTERFPSSKYRTTDDGTETGRLNEYHPVRHVETFQLDDLPSQGTFLEKLTPADADE